MQYPKPLRIPNSKSQSKDNCENFCLRKLKLPNLGTKDFSCVEKWEAI